jgi:hypothetical protein
LDALTAAKTSWKGTQIGTIPFSSPVRSKATSVLDNFLARKISMNVYRKWQALFL